MHKVQGPSLFKIMKDYREIRKDPLAYGLKLNKEYGDFIDFKIARYHVLALNHPDFHEYVLKTNYRNFIKGKAYERMEPLLGKGLLIAPHEFWRQNRTIVNPAFRVKKLEGYFQEIVQSTEQLLNNYRDNHVYDIHQNMMELTLSVISKVLFQIDLRGRSEKVSEAIHDYMAGMESQIFHLFSFQKHIPTKTNRKFNKAVEYLNSIIFELVSQRRKDYHKRDDMISLLIKAQAENNASGITDEYLRDELMTFMVGGHETTANSLTWTLYYLSKNPAIYKKLLQEIEEKIPGDIPKFNELDQCPYLDCVINETLRISPPVWITSREIKEDDEFQGVKMKKGMIAIVAAYYLHHHPDYWERPSEFIPERFEKEYNKKAYVPFGLGPRSCIGEHLARVELRTILIMFLKKFEFETDPAKPTRPLATITLRPDGGLFMKLRKRNG